MRRTLKNDQVITDVGSSLNVKRKGFLKLLRMILNNEVSKAIAYPDRLVRFGFEILEEMCRAHNYEIVTLREDETPERELVEDLISIVVSFSGKLYAAVMELSLKYRPVIKVKSSNCHKWSRLTGEMSLPGFEI